MTTTKKRIEKLQQEINALSNQLGGAGDIVTELKKIKDEIRKAENIAAKPLKKIESKTPRAGVAAGQLDALTKIMFAARITAIATVKFKESIKEAANYQKVSLGRGLGLESLLKENLATQEQLQGLTGFGIALETTWANIESGMNTSNKATKELALYTKLTGGNQKALLTALDKTTVGMNLSAEQETKLSKSIISLSQNFKISAEEIVSSMEGLGSQMRQFKLLGLGPQMMGAAGALGAAMGKAGGPLAGQFLSEVLSAKGLFTSIFLDVNDERLAILRDQGDITENVLRLAEKAGKTASDRLAMWTKGSADPMVVLQMLEKSMTQGFGTAALVWAQVVEEGRKAGRTGKQQLAAALAQKEANEKWTNTWINFKSLVWEPLDRKLKGLVSGVVALNEKYPDLIRITTQLVYLLGTVVGILTGAKLLKFLTGVGAARGAAVAAAPVAGAASAGGWAALISAITPILYLGGAVGVLWLFGKAMTPVIDNFIRLKDVNFEAVAAFGVSLLSLFSVVAALGALSASIIGGAFFAIGLVALASLTAILANLGARIVPAAPALESLNNVLGKLLSAPMHKLKDLGTYLKDIGEGLSTIGGADSLRGVAALETVANLIDRGNRNVTATATDGLSVILDEIKLDIKGLREDATNRTETGGFWNKSINNLTEAMKTRPGKSL